MRRRKGSVDHTTLSLPQCVMPELLVYVQALDRVACAFKQDECDVQDERDLSSARALQVLGPVVKWTTGCQWGCSRMSCNSGTKSSLGPNSYFTDGLIYSQKLTLGYMLLVPPMPPAIALAN